MPLAIIGSLTICTVIYILTAIAAVPPALPAAVLAESDAPLAQALDVGAGIDWAASLTAFGAVVAITSVILAMYYGQTRIFFAMARDGLMPERLAEVSPRTGVPVKLTIGFGILMAVLAALVPPDELVKLVNIGTLVFFLLVSVGVIVLRRTRPDMPRPFRVPLVPVVPLMDLCLDISVDPPLPPFPLWRFCLCVDLPLLLCPLWVSHNSPLGRRAPPPSKNPGVQPGGRVSLAP